MKGALGLLAIVAVIYIFWLTYVFLKRTKNDI
jgi:hypothetical protein